MTHPSSASITPAGVIRGDVETLQALVLRRGIAVLTYCEIICRPGYAPQAAAEALAAFRALVVSRSPDAGVLDPERLLRTATRRAAAAHAPEPPPPSGLGRRLAARGPGPCALVAELLAAQAEGVLSARDRERLAAHLERCPDCRAAEQRFIAAERAYVEPPDRPLPPALVQTLLDAMLGAAPAPAGALPANGSGAGEADLLEPEAAEMAYEAGAAAPPGEPAANGGPPTMSFEMLDEDLDVARWPEADPDTGEYELPTALAPLLPIEIAAPTPSVAPEPPVAAETGPEPALADEPPAPAPDPDPPPPVSPIDPPTLVEPPIAHLYPESIEHVRTTSPPAAELDDFADTGAQPVLEEPSGRARRRIERPRLRLAGSPLPRSRRRSPSPFVSQLEAAHRGHPALRVLAPGVVLIAALLIALAAAGAFSSGSHPTRSSAPVPPANVIPEPAPASVAAAPPVQHHRAAAPAHHVTRHTVRHVVVHHHISTTTATATTPAATTPTPAATSTPTPTAVVTPPASTSAPVTHHTPAPTTVTAVSAPTSAVPPDSGTTASGSGFTPSG